MTEVTTDDLELAKEYAVIIERIGELKERLCINEDDVELAKKYAETLERIDASKAE